MVGSSPLTRGKRIAVAGQRPRWRLIPAHAGKTAAVRRRPGRVRAHPRSRGENSFRAVAGGRGLGSSPLTRGKRVRFRGRRPGGGLIPAHAGKTPVVGVEVVSTWAHPRSRGENHGLGVVPVIPSGSSPLTRGKRRSRRSAVTRRGLIPAHAGKTLRHARSAQIAGAHPRSRGENVRPWHAGRSRGGSSPLTRGKPDSRTWHYVDSGLIPAHAGKTLSATSSQCVDWAHPRSRGENRSNVGPGAPVAGSSPLTRGKPERGRGRQRGHRLIPAHAGKTAVCMASMRREPAHPRSRGENPPSPPPPA